MRVEGDEGGEAGEGGERDQRGERGEGGIGAEAAVHLCPLKSMSTEIDVHCSPCPLQSIAVH